MTTITRTADGITITGHAGYAKAGQDIVCAGISTLAQTLIASIEELTEDKITYNAVQADDIVCLSPGKVDIKHGNLSEQAQLLVNSFFVGVEMIADIYPEYVQIAQACKA